MTILVDMDDTIEQLLKAWVSRANEKFGRNVSLDEITGWNVAAPYSGLTRKQIYDVTYEKGFWESVEPMPGAAEALQHFMAEGHEVFIVTATEPEHVEEKMNGLLFRYFPFLSWNQVIITGRKQMIRGDVLIDDGIHNLEGGAYQKIMFTAPHNRFYDAEAHGMKRVRTWDEAVEIIDAMASGSAPSPINSEKAAENRCSRAETRIAAATEADTDAVLRLYREQLGREFCFWDEDYPGPETVAFDLSRNALFVMKNGNGEVIAAISIEEDEDVDALDCWTPSLQPGGEFARLAVTPACQNRGLAREMVSHVLKVLKERGFKSVHILVNRDNIRAIRSYAPFGFRTAGECEMYQQHFLCYEKAL